MRLPGILPPVDALDNDDWYTPPYIFEALGLEFDLDPCAPVGGLPWIPAKRSYSEEDDGLAQEWTGRVWLNPPYSGPWPWLEKLAGSNCTGIALVPADTATKGFQKWATTAWTVCFLRGRVTFIQPGNDNVASARFPSALVAYGHEEGHALEESRLGWCVPGLR